MVYEFPHHAVPLALVILSSVFAIGHQFYLIGEAQNVGELFEQVQAVALKAVIAIQRLIGFLVHHVGVFLKHDTFFAVSLSQNVQFSVLPDPDMSWFLFVYQNSCNNEGSVSHGVGHIGGRFLGVIC